MFQYGKIIRLKRELEQTDFRAIPRGSRRSLTWYYQPLRCNILNIGRGNPLLSCYCIDAYMVCEESLQ